MTLALKILAGVWLVGFVVTAAVAVVSVRNDPEWAGAGWPDRYLFVVGMAAAWPVVLAQAIQAGRRRDGW